MCPIDFVGAGKKVQVIRLLGGMSFMNKLKEMGILPGSELEVVQNNGGPILLGVGNSRFALGKGIANRIYVREI